MANDAPYSRIIAGTMTWGSWGKQLSKAEMNLLMHHCLELGISTFDHADIYGNYTMEAEFGNAFKDSGISREKIQLISKCGIQKISENRSTELKHYNYSGSHIIWSVEHSLKNLKTDFLDLLLLHRPSPLMSPQEIGEAIFKLKKEGKIKRVGVSNFTPSQIALLETIFPITTNQVEFSLTENTVMYDGSFDDCITQERLAMAWSPLGGFFKEDNAQLRRINKVVKPLLKKYDVTADQLLLAWILKHPVHIYPVVGSTAKERLKKSVEALEIELELEDWFRLLHASQGHEVP
ncbi:MAG: aldo/keto reductase [Aurantibacter sp.]